MLNFFKKLFQMIFGGGDSPTTEEKPVTETQQTDPPKEEVEETRSQPEGLQLELKRTSYGELDTIGEMYVNGKLAAYTIESPKASCISEGTHPLSLRTTGGKHSSYWFKFKHIHKGMIFIEGDHGDLFPTLSIGNIGKEARGSILIGKELKSEASPREVWYSTDAYKALYPQISEALESGKKLSLTISS